jgi:hypothetical protein
MYLYVIKNCAKRSLFRWNTCPQALRPISVTDKDMYLCKKQCSNYDCSGGWGGIGGGGSGGGLTWCW